MKIVFLDIDGVLNSESFWSDKTQGARYREAVANGCSKTEQLALANIDPKAVDLLNKILEETDAELVISSTWRTHLELPEILAFMGVKKQIYSVTPTTLKRHRGTEIQMWLDCHPDIDNYIILDDDSDMLNKQLNHFIHTSWKNGLTLDHVDKAIKILNNGAIKA